MRERNPSPPVHSTQRCARQFSVEETALAWAAATPQAFREEILRRVLALDEEATDEAALCERLGIPVAIAPISRLGFKVTTPEDLELAEAILAERMNKEHTA